MVYVRRRERVDTAVWRRIPRIQSQSSYVYSKAEEKEIKAIRLENHYEKLVKFGLSPNQAKTYLTLVRLGECTAKRIWENSEIPREEVYRKLNELQEFGIGIKI